MGALARRIAAALLLCWTAMTGQAAEAQSAGSPQMRVEDAVNAGQAELRRRAGPSWSVKAARSDRVLAGQPQPGDLGALEAEAQARGRAESALAVATLHASRRDRYLAGLARLDGARVRALLALAQGEPESTALGILSGEIAAAQANLPATE